MKIMYHINPETGNPGRCTATHLCKFAQDGMPPVHYDSEQEALEAHEDKTKDFSIRTNIESINKKIIDNRNLTKDEVVYYATFHKIISLTSQTNTVLQKMLDNENGLCRQCLVDQIRDEKGITLGQGGTRIIATLRDRGFNIKKNVKKYCSKHKGKKPFDKLEQPYITSLSFIRVNWSKKEREIIMNAFPEQKDSISGVENSDEDPLEIDHRIPVQRQIKDKISTEDIEITENISNETIRNTYQLLTRKNNLIKDRACSSCITKNIKPNSINGIVSITGNGAGAEYDAEKNNCSTCVFAYPEKFGLPISVSMKE